MLLYAPSPFGSGGRGLWRVLKGLANWRPSGAILPEGNLVSLPEIDFNIYIFWYKKNYCTIN